MKIELLVIGRLKKGPHADLAQDYLKRLNWDVSITALESRHKDEHQGQIEELSLLKSHIQPSAYVIAMDERGKTLGSRALAQKFTDLQNQNRSLVQFIIGGANGLDDEIRDRADFLLSFGAQTWPHMLARVMLLEQIYRCQQIHLNHPYHRD